jgi:hypothetical protein
MARGIDQHPVGKPALARPEMPVALGVAQSATLVAGLKRIISASLQF